MDRLHLHRIAHADALRKVGRMIAPMMPVMTTAIAVMEVTPPSISATATAIGLLPISAREKASCFRLQTEQMAEEQHAADGYHRADERAGAGDGQQVFQQYIQLAVNRDRNALPLPASGRTRSACRIPHRSGRGAGCDQQRTDQNRGNQQRIADRRTGFLLNSTPGA